MSVRFVVFGWYRLLLVYSVVFVMFCLKNVSMSVDSVVNSSMYILLVSMSCNGVVC